MGVAFVPLGTLLGCITIYCYLALFQVSTVRALSMYSAIVNASSPSSPVDHYRYRFSLPL